jgi:choline kinase
VHDEEIKVKVDPSSRVMEISKEVDPAQAAGESIGIELFRGKSLYELFRIIEKKVVGEKKVNQFYETAFEELSDLYTVDTTEFFCMEIDTAEDLASAEELVLNHNSQK